MNTCTNERAGSRAVVVVRGIRGALFATLALMALFATVTAGRAPVAMDIDDSHRVAASVEATTQEIRPVSATTAGSGPMARASVWDCINIGKNLNIRILNPATLINTIRRIPGCGDFLAANICWQTHQWWGGGARWLVSQITRGATSRC